MAEWRRPQRRLSWLAVVSALVVSAAANTAAAGTATAKGGTWDTPTSLTGGLIQSVSCAMPGYCNAGGRDSEADSQAIVGSESNATWGSAREVATGLNVSGASVLSVSCASPGNCGAGGFYTDRAVRTQAFVVTQAKGQWGTAHEVGAALNVGGSAQVNSMSCTAPGDCGAGGFYASKNGSQVAFVVSETKGDWGPAQKVTGTSAGVLAAVSSVSCVSPGNCTAGGAEGADQQAFVVKQTKGTWGAAQVVVAPAGTTSAQVNSVSCASASGCGAGGTYSDADGDFHAFVATEKNGTWGAALPVPGVATVSGGPAAQVLSVSCASAGNCVAGGLGGDGKGFVADQATGNWENALAVTGGAAIQSVSCTTVGNCSAGGYTGSSEALVVSEVDGHWTGAHLISGGTIVSAVSCAAPGDCAAGGGTTAAKALVVDQTDPIVGIYSDLAGTTETRAAVSDGWPLLANVAGQGRFGNCGPPWLGPVPPRVKVDSDGSVEHVLSKHPSDHPFWISYWTPEVPPVGTDLLDAGKAAGKAAAADLEKAAKSVPTPVAPTFVALDFETSAPSPEPSAKSCGSNVDPRKQPKPRKGDKQCWDWASPKQRNCYDIDPAGWKQFALGWAAGISAAGPIPLSPAIYLNKSEYGKDKAGAYDLPVIVALGFGGKPLARPTPNVIGYAAFYAHCTSVASDLARVRSWGHLYNSVQFQDSKVHPPADSAKC